VHRLPPGPPSLPRPKVMTSRALAARPGLLTDFLNLCVYSDSEDSFGAVFAPLWTVLDLMTHGCFIEEANRSKELANTRRGFPFQTVSSRPASGDAPRARRAPKQHGDSFLPSAQPAQPGPARKPVLLRSVPASGSVCASVRTHAHALTSMRTPHSVPASRKSPGKSPGHFTVPHGDLQDVSPMRPHRFDHHASESCTEVT